MANRRQFSNEERKYRDSVDEVSREKVNNKIKDLGSISTELTADGYKKPTYIDILLAIFFNIVGFLFVLTRNDWRKEDKIAVSLLSLLPPIGLVYMYITTDWDFQLKRRITITAIILFILYFFPYIFLLVVFTLRGGN